MSTSKRFGAEFLCNVRYQTALPPPPFVPKLLDVPKSTERFVEYRHSSLVESTPYPLHTNADLGMPIDLFQLDAFSKRKEKPNPSAKLDPKDRALLVKPPAEGFGARSRQFVPWLRRTEYISSEITRSSPKGKAVESSFGLSATKGLEDIDYSLEGQIASVERTFKSANDPDLMSKLKHPKNPNIKPVEITPIFPDFQRLGSSYTQCSYDGFPDPTVEDKSSSSNADLTKSTNSILKPMQNPHDPSETFLAFFLPTESATEKLKKRKADELEEETSYDYEWVRDYTYESVPCTSFTQLMVYLGEDKTAHYVPIRSRLVLKKKRAKSKRGAEPYKKPTHLQITHRRPNEEEKETLREALRDIYVNDDDKEMD
ncbi:hypothetical protein K493DRAFT_312073 [Basidiobolus meristosporus CBS 931.73]|uniref:RNA polymerase II-associated n=1 Tax=Basidiobolus meristosporus CBS 931.73 TaxID=1314790 RepID=A0A1Y1YXX1_9FUNG|nr:hypothetical protein K493DRAFT_312073 [Basidiobolus meristosporus CBS 931.73]|eukprot:ORY02415.1 hypothetical protein K493DRAFT_312073 [Basidiobolus meristosporus CBS 931.73]